MEQTLTLTRGLSASGKSTWAEDMVKSTDQIIRLERDLLRDQLFGHRDYSRLTSADEQMVSVIQKAMAVAAFKAGKSVIVSDTNLRATYVREWAKLAAIHGVNFEIVDFDSVSVDQLVERDKNRQHEVGEKLIRDMAAKFLKKGKLVPVDVSKELVNSLKIEPYANPTNLPTAIIVDIDGTLATMHGRSPYEWHRVGEDSPVQAVISAVRTAAYYNRIIVMSGRDESCRYITETWLGQYLGVGFQLYMRPEGDNRKDDLVKYELFNKYVRDEFHVSYVLDDRDQVVKMWRSLGLPCFQVNYGDF